MTKFDPEIFMKRFKSHDKMGDFLGAKIVSISSEECTYEYEATPAHHNPNGILHGGALFTVMDSSQGAFVHFSLDEKFVAAATGTATIRYSAPVKTGLIKVRTWLKEAQGRKLFVTSEARDESGTVVATLEEIWIAILK
jgi:uncharacterized protein (TIGR00369 family)